MERERLSRGARKHNRLEKARARKEGRPARLLFATHTPIEVRKAIKDLRVAEKMRSKQVERRERRMLALKGVVFYRRESGD